MKNALNTAASLMCMLALTLFISCGKDDGGESSPDPVLISFAETELFLSETGTEQMITVSLVEALEEDASITIRIGENPAYFGPLATYGEDFTTEPDGSNGSFVIEVPAGETSQTFTVQLLDDQEVEEREHFALWLESDSDLLGVDEDDFLDIYIESEDYEEILVIFDRDNKMHKISLDDGSISPLITATNAEGNLSDITSLAYHPNSGKGVITADDEFYSLDLETGESTPMTFTTGSDEVFRRFYDLLINEQGEITFSSYYGDDDNQDLGINLLNNNGEASNLVTFGSLLCCSGALAMGSTDHEVYLGQRGGFSNVEIETGEQIAWVDITCNDLSPFTSVNESFDLTQVFLQNFGVDRFGNTYAIARYTGDAFVVSIDFTSGEIEYVAFDNEFDGGLAFVPAAFFE